MEWILRYIETGKRLQRYVMAEACGGQVKISIRTVPKMVWVMLLVLALALASFAAASGSGSAWTVGRAVIEPMPGSPGPMQWVVKLSLRNEGRPDRTRVKIFGRWVRSGLQGNQGFIPLGILNNEVALKQTAIVVLSLRPLGPEPPGTTALEMLVRTGNVETGHQIVPLR